MLTGLSAYWFARTRDLVPNHLLAVRPDGRSLECRRLEMLPIELVVRGYLAGSGWRGLRGTGALRARAAAGLTEAEHLPDPIVTPPRKPPPDTTRTSRRTRRRPSRRRALLGGARGRARLYAGARTCRAGRNHRRRHEVRARPRRRGASRARRRGAHARLVAVLARGRDTCLAGRSRPSTSSTCATTASRRAGTRLHPGPELPPEVVAGTRARYVEAFERLTGIPFPSYVADPEVVL